MSNSPDSQDAAAKSDAKKWLVPVAALTVGLLAALAVTRVPLFQQALGVVPAVAAAETEEVIEFGVFAELDGIVVNPRGSDGRRYFMVKVGVEAEDQKTLDRLEEVKPAALDGVIALLSERSVAELTDVSQRDSLKVNVKQIIDNVLGDDGPLSRIYFTQYVLQ
ncbi:flagellar basal body-associated FliL family protein [Rubrivirga sp.]|uniref:flagellar basal body-associated FliL family protein n=1 Tax=Rubrivirga sp. TaxID=1885344 RepID=UPI003C7480CD